MTPLVTLQVMHRVGMIIHAKGPAIKIPAVEKLDAIGRRDDFLRGAFCQRER